MKDFVKGNAKLYAGEQIVQIELGTGSDGRPFIVALTSVGRILCSYAIHGQGGWEVTELPELKETAFVT